LSLRHEIASPLLTIPLLVIKLGTNAVNAQTPGSDIAEAANNLLAALTPEQKGKACVRGVERRAR
jgi:hypothetical protein